MLKTECIAKCLEYIKKAKIQDENINLIEKWLDNPNSITKTELTAARFTAKTLVSWTITAILSDDIKWIEHDLNEIVKLANYYERNS